VGGSRTSMGPPPPPATRPARQSLAGGPGVGNRASAPVARSASGRTSLAPKPRLRSGSERVVSIDSQVSEGSGHDTGDEGGMSPLRNQDSFSPKTISPVLSRTSAIDRNRDSPTSTRASGSSVTQRTTTSNATVSREIEDLKTKCRVMEKKRLEDREKLKEMEKLRSDKDKLERAVQILQTNLQNKQEQINELDQRWKEGEAQNDSTKKENEDRDHALELAILDKLMAEEQYETLKIEVITLREKSEEYELEVEVLRAEKAELEGEMTPEEKTSKGWLQMERDNGRLREALMRLRDMTQEAEHELNDKIKGLEVDLRELSGVEEQFQTVKEKLATSESNVRDLKEQLDVANSAEDVILELQERNHAQSEQIDELNAIIEDLESLRELNDELEINHVETEKEMQEDIDFKDNIINEQVRRSTQQEAAMGDMEYTLSKFRELVTILQSDLEDMKASHSVTETESEQLTSRSRAMMDLNMKLQVSAAKTQVKTIDLELRRLEAQEASEHLAIVQLFLPDAFDSEKNSVLALLRFKRVAFKANLLLGFVKERVNGQPPVGHEDDIFAGCAILDKLAWISAMCDRFTNAIGHCSTEEFAKFESALYELEPVERNLNGWIDGLRRDELKEKQCASELEGTVRVLKDLARKNIPSGLANYADDVHMQTLVMQTHLETAASALSVARTMVQTVIPSQGSEDELAQHFNRKTESIITQTRSAKVIIGKAVRALEDLKTRSLSLAPDTMQSFKECEKHTRELADFSRHVGDGLYTLLHEEGRAEPYTYLEVQSSVHRTTTTLFTSSESDLFSTYSNKLRTLTTSLSDLVAMASDLDMTQEFERSPAPWIIRSQELKTSKIVPLDTEEQMNRLKDENNERARLVKQRDQTLEEAAVKIELLESRMRDATKKNERITELERKIEEAKQHEAKLNDTIEIRDKELAITEADRERWKKTAEDTRAIGIVVPGSQAGHERAVATAREMEALKIEIASLQAAVRYLREDSRRARLVDSQSLSWLDAPLTTSKDRQQLRKDLVVAEGNDVLNELLNLTKSAKVYDLSQLPQDRLAWRPAKLTPQYYVAKQREDFEAWNGWRKDVKNKGRVLVERDVNSDAATVKRAAARVEMQLSGWPKCGVAGEVEIYEPDDWQGFKGQLGFV
jgi:dynactin 1